MTARNEMTSHASRSMLRRDLDTARRNRPRPARRGVGRGILATFAGLAVAGLSVAYLSPLGALMTPPATADVAPITLYTSALGDAQTMHVASTQDRSTTLNRDSYSVWVTPKPTPTPTPTPEETRGQATSFQIPFVAPDPGTAQAIAYDMVTARGWGDDEFSCLVALWNRESGWRVNAYNPSGAYGIPQALPGSKMASAGDDWATNPATQIAWGLGYISGRYGTPCGAWGYSNANGWY